jgi:allantoin racemase
MNAPPGPLPRLLVVNSNTDAATTAKVAAVVGALAPDHSVDGRTATFGPHGIGGRCDAVISAHATLVAFAAAVADDPTPPAAGIVACFSDPGLAAVREAFDFPVVGIAEAAFHTACMLGGRFAVVTVSDRVAPVIEELAELYGLAGRLARVETLDAALLKVPDPVPAFAEACARVVRDHRAEAIVIGGAAFAGLAAPIGALVDVPFVGSVEAAAVQAAALARLGARAPRTGSYAVPSPKLMRGLDPALAARLGLP